jgi:hypothetical protein
MMETRCGIVLADSHLAQVFRPEAVRCQPESSASDSIAARSGAAVAFAFVAAEPQNYGESPRIYAGEEHFSAPKKSRHVCCALALGISRRAANLAHTKI